MNTYKKRIISCICSIAALFAIGFVPTTAEDNVIRIEGEDAAEMNFTRKTTADSSASGGEFLVLNVGEEHPEGDKYYYQKYNVTVPEDGCYNIKFAGLQFGASWASYIGVSVNDGPIKDSSLCGNSIGGVGGGMYGTLLSNIGGFKAGENTLTIYCMGPRNSDSRYVVHTDYIELTPGEWCVSNIEMINDVTMNIYERGAEIECFVNYSEATKEDTRINYELIDYYDNIVSSGSYVAKRGTESERLSLGVLDICHYTLYVYPEGSESKSHTYVSVVKPESERVYSNDSPFGLDGAFAWVVSESEAYELLRAERLAGIIYNRDRYTQKSTSPAKDEYDFDLGNSKKVFDKADELGVNIQAATVYLPEWARDADSYLTDDLLSVYKIAKEEGKAFGDSIDIYELWNEPETDIETNIYETADRFAGVSKAMALGFMDSGTNAKISTAGYTAGIARYLDLAIRNDAAEFTDFMNFHSHITAVEGAKTNSLTSRQAVNADSTLKKYGYYNKSLSLDESGIITQFKDGHEYSRDQQKVRAGYYVTVNAQNMANGVDRHYWYIVLQRGSAMSMFTEDGNGPYPEYNAVATTTDVLGVPEYLGEVNSLKGGAKGYAFNNKNNGRDIMVLWSENPVEFRFASNESVEVIDVMGKEETVAPTDGEITLTIADQPIFVRANNEFESEVYTPKKKAPKRENSIDRSKITKAQRVLLQQSYPKEVSEGAKTKGYQIDETGTELTLTVTNLNEEKMAGVVYGKAFDGWKLSDDEISVSLEPMSQQQFKLRLTPTDKVQYNVESAVRFVGMFDGEETTNCVTLVQMPKDGEYEWYCEFKEATDINEWIADESNIGGGAIGSKITLENANGGLKFNYDFDPATPDMWSFPSFEFNEIPDLTMTDGIIIRYEGTKDTAPDELLSRIIVKEESSGAAYFTIQGFYMEKGVHEVLIPWDRLVFQTGADPTFMLEKDNIATFSLGINNIRKVLDVPEYTILKIGAYVGARTEDKHGTIKCEYPKNGACISNSEKLVAIGKICDDDIKVERNKIRVYVDGFPAEHIIEGDEVKADIGELEAGEHTVKFNWECEDSAAYNEEVSFVADSGDKVFSDVAEEHWAADKIANLAARGVVSGDEDGAFRPDDNVTRAEYIKMLTTVLKFKNVYDKAGFTDVSAHDWFYDYVAAASEAGLFDGVYEGEFGADTVISREDMATFTYRALKAAGITLPNTNVKQIFLDKDEISSYAKTPINMLQQAGIVEGMENRKFLPSDGLTRAEAAKVLYEVIVHIL